MLSRYHIVQLVKQIHLQTNVLPFYYLYNGVEYKQNTATRYNINTIEHYHVFLFFLDQMVPKPL